MYAVGLMSGTSLDGIDAVLCNIESSGKTIQLKQLAFDTYPFEDSTKERIKRCCHNEATVADVCSLNFELGALFADATKRICAAYGITTDQLGFIASHGQTIYHIPKATETHAASTLQIGEAAVIAQECGAICVSNFRTKDIAAGGEGAPLVPFSEYILYQSEDESVALQNIGGIGNVTVLPASADIDDIYAFDTGPGNMVVDEAMRQLYGREYDNNGEVAAQGQLIPELGDQLKRDPYIEMAPPKTTGREVYGAKFTQNLLNTYAAEKPEDIIATLTWFTAYTIAENYRLHVLNKHQLNRVVIGGGGAHNQALLHYLAQELPGIEVMTQEELGYSSDAKEAIAFVILGNETLHKNFSNVPSATGAKHKVILGSITYPN